MAILIPARLMHSSLGDANLTYHFILVFHISSERKGQSKGKGINISIESYSVLFSHIVFASVVWEQIRSHFVGSS